MFCCGRVSNLFLFSYPLPQHPAMKMHLALLLNVALLFPSCGAGSSTHASKTDSAAPAVTEYDNTLPKGLVKDSVICAEYAEQTYALYLPSYYTAERAFPCICFFDAHARGALPLKMYKELAERYGFVLVGSNMSKNGTPWQVTERWANTLLHDVNTRIHLDTKRVYTAGFSGGSRVAANVAINIGGIAGVVGCAAGFPQLDKPLQDKFAYFGLVGDHDFNMIEMETLDGALQQNAFPHQLLVSSGMHGWAEAAEFNTAMLWLQVNAIKQQLQPKSDSLIAALKNDYERRIAAAKMAGELIWQQRLLTGIVQILDGMTDIAPYRAQLAALTELPAYAKKIAEQQKWHGIETNQQRELMSQFTAQDIDWWQRKIAELRQRAHAAQTTEERKLNERLLNYLGLVGYLTSNRAIKTNDLTNAATYLQIFKMADPENPDYSYLAATYYAQKGDKVHTIQALNEAAALGYSEPATVVSDPLFAVLKDDPEFKSVVNKIKVNYSSR